MQHINLNLGSATIPFYYRPGTSDEAVLQQIFVNNDYSLAPLKLADQLTSYANSQTARGLRPLILDLGANIGASALYLTLAHPNSRIIAVEPDPANCEYLAANTTSHDCIVVEGAISSTPGTASLTDPGLGPWSYRTAHDPSGTVRTYTVPDLLTTHGGTSFFPFIAKIDIEGAESDLFSCNTDWIDQFPVLIIELHDWLFPGANTARNFLRCIADKQRDFISIGENVFSIRTPIADAPSSAVSTAAGAHV